MLTKYDPNRPPDPQRWLATDEDQRRMIIERYHRRIGFRAPDDTVHVIAHLVVENQAAFGNETPVAATLLRLMDEGVDRHEALHAVASVLLWHIKQVIHDEIPLDPNPVQIYYAELEKLTIAGWRAEYTRRGGG